MDKKTNKQNPDEEYKLQEASTESGRHFTAGNTGGDAASTILEKTKRQHIFLIVFIIFSSLGVYKLVSKLVHKVSDVSSQAKLVEKTQKPIAISPAAVQANMALDNRFNHIEQGQRDLQSHLLAFDSELSDIKSTLADLNSRLVDINEQAQLLRTQQETFLQKQQKTEAKRAEIKKLAPKPIYYVRAIIPGRVWLTLQDGSTLTLGLGDKLSGYGVITVIDPSQGTITLSSGAVIGYNPDDR
jgi:intracellular multiplication protein IcmG